MWKIIWCDGFNRESVAERLVAEHINNKDEAETMLKSLLDRYGSDACWYRVVPQAKKLWRGMEELV